MGTAKAGDRVRVHYTGTFADGTVFDSSKDRDPLELRLGEGTVIEGFEKAVENMSEGDAKKVTIPKESAYGERRKELFFTVDREAVPHDVGIEVGAALEIQQSGGERVVVRVAEVREAEIVLDANHPLAGQDLTFEIELVEIVG